MFDGYDEVNALLDVCQINAMNVMLTSFKNSKGPARYISI